MHARSVIQFWEEAREADLEVCIDGGWAVDALLGKQTRRHKDLDIALPASRVLDLRSRLDAQGYVEIPQHDTWEHNFVLQAPNGNTIDVHSYALHPDGRSKFGCTYTADQLNGTGVILGTHVRCVPPRWLVAFHAGYELAEKDWQDVRQLCAKFDIEIPKIYEQFARLDDNH
jgi:lincosamide nucleotidyltransferase A/C/D/E